MHNVLMNKALPWQADVGTTEKIFGDK